MLPFGFKEKVHILICFTYKRLVMHEQIKSCHFSPLHNYRGRCTMFSNSKQGKKVPSSYAQAINNITFYIPAKDCLDLMPWIPVWSWSWVGMSKNMFPVQWMYWWSVENMAEEDCFWLLSVALLINPNLWTKYSQTWW